MSDLRMRSLEQVDFDTILAEDVEFEGEIVFEKPLMIKGKFSGDVKSADDLYIGERAVLDATIDAGKISVHGTVKGNVTAQKRLELYGTCRLKGDVRTPDLVMESGCMFNGTCRMSEKEVKRDEKR